MTTTRIPAATTPIQRANFAGQTKPAAQAQPLVPSLLGPKRPNTTLLRAADNTSQPTPAAPATTPSPQAVAARFCESVSGQTLPWNDMVQMIERNYAPEVYFKDSLMETFGRDAFIAGLKKTSTWKMVRVDVVQDAVLVRDYEAYGHVTFVAQRQLPFGLPKLSMEINAITYMLFDTELHVTQQQDKWDLLQAFASMWSKKPSTPQKPQL